MILVITANSNTCRIYHYNKHPAGLTLHKEINHPENKLKNSDLTSDKSGHYQGGTSAHGAYSPHMDAKDIKIDNFSREIANELNQERNHNGYEHLILIAPPHVCGLLSQHLNKHVKDLISNHIQKDIVHLPDHELLKFLQENAKYSD